MITGKGFDQAAFKWENGCLMKEGVALVDLSLIYDSEQLLLESTLEEVEEGVFAWEVGFRLQGSQLESLHQLELVATHKADTTYHMIPAVSYNGNQWGTGKDPKGFEVEGQPWVFAHHRTAIPGATYSQSKKWTVTLFGQSDVSGFSCSLRPNPAQTEHRLIWPLQEGPRTYIRKNDYGEAYREEWLLQPHHTYTLRAYLVVHPLQSQVPGWSYAWDFAWRQAYSQRQLQPSHHTEQLWAWGIDYVKTHLWAEEGTFRGTSIGLTWQDADREGEGKWIQRPTMKYKIGWTGQNISLANSLLQDYIRTGATDSLQRGLLTLDSWVEQAQLDNGLLRCHFDYLIPDSVPDARETQDAVHLGDAVMNLFEAAKLADQAGADGSRYLRAALKVCDFTVSTQQADGLIGKSWYNDGACADRDGTIGCALVSPLVLAYQATENPMYLERAERGYRCYLEELRNNGYTTAGALDTHCIDKEAAIPILQAGLLLYEVTQNVDYLEGAVYASWYLATWQWHHTVDYPAGSVLHDLKYDTFGGTSVSTQHHHLDPYALKYVADWLKLSEWTGDRSWRDRAHAAWYNGMIGISDGSLRVMGKLRPRGSQDEGFYHTAWGFHINEQRFGVSEWLVAWPTAFRLETLRRVEQWQLETDR